MNPTTNSKKLDDVTQQGSVYEEILDTTGNSSLDEWIATGGRGTPRNQDGSKIPTGTQVVDDDPFKPRASLCRSPTKEARQVMDEVVLLSPEGEAQQTPTREVIPNKQVREVKSLRPEEAVVVQRARITKITDQVACAKEAIKAIYDYAVATKNVSRLLKEMGGKALFHLGVLSKELDIISSTNPVEKGKENNKTHGSKMEERDFGTQTSPDGNIGYGYQTGGAVTPVQRETMPGRTMNPVRQGKRKEVSPLEQKVGKQQRRKNALNDQVEAIRTTNGEVDKRGGEEPRPPDAAGPTQGEADENEFQEWRKRKRKLVIHAKGEMENLPMIGKNRRKAGRKGEAVSLRLGPGLTFADAVKRMKANMGAAPDGLKKIRRTLIGDLLVEFDPGADATEFYNKISGKMGQGVELRRLQPKVDIEIRDIDPSVEGTEILSALSTQLKIVSEELRLKSLRTNRPGMKYAVIEMPESQMKTVNQTTSIKIGWTRCKMRVLPKVSRCFSCHGFGHLAKNCPRGPEAKDTCRKCGEEGHKMDGCLSEARCSLCHKAGKNGNALGHVAGSIRCPIYKEALQKSGFKNAP